jgi:hypothetical protein
LSPKWIPLMKMMNTNPPSKLFCIMKKHQKSIIKNKSIIRRESLKPLPEDMRGGAKKVGKKLKVKLHRTTLKFGMKKLSAKLHFPKDFCLISCKTKLLSIKKILRLLSMTHKIWCYWINFYRKLSIHLKRLRGCPKEANKENGLQKWWRNAKNLDKNARRKIR